jgi:hypothetical protein
MNKLRSSVVVYVVKYIVSCNGLRVTNNGFYIGFIGTSVTVSLNYNQFRAIANLHTFQFMVAHALGFSVPTSRLLAKDFNTETITSNHYEVFLPFLIQSPWTADFPEVAPIQSSAYIQSL